MSAKPSYEFRRVASGLETLSRGVSLPRHHHAEGYALIVLSGSVTEVSFAGRSYAEAGHVLLHGKFDCHLDRVSSKQPLDVLRLPWQHDSIEGQFRLTDPDQLVRLAEMDAAHASARLYEELRAVTPRDRYWVDDLACTLREGSNLQFGDWAETRGLRPDTVSHVFHREFGVSPKRFRLECRTRLAWREIMRTTCPLTEIAFTFDFSDLAHLSRSIHLLTGRSPSAWRSALAVNPQMRLSDCNSESPGDSSSLQWS